MVAAAAATSPSSGTPVASSGKAARTATSRRSPSSSGTVYVGGHYENYCGPGGGQHICTTATPRNKLLAVSTSTGALQSWDPSANSVLGVFALAATGATMGVGGDFTSTGQRPQQHFALYK